MLFFPCLNKCCQHVKPVTIRHVQLGNQRANQEDDENQISRTGRKPEGLGDEIG
jgi:hypothetical protein